MCETNAAGMARHVSTPLLTWDFQLTAIQECQDLLPELQSPLNDDGEAPWTWLTPKRPSTSRPPKLTLRMFSYLSQILSASWQYFVCGTNNLIPPYYIGYTRVILAGLSLHFMSFHPKYCTLAYVISCLLDAVDGQAARALGQTSKFGAVLDMVTDRCVFWSTYSLWC